MDATSIASFYVSRLLDTQGTAIDISINVDLHSNSIFVKVCSHDAITTVFLLPAISILSQSQLGFIHT